MCAGLICLAGIINGSDIETLNKLQFANGLFRDGMYEIARKQFVEISGSSYPGGMPLPDEKLSFGLQGV